MVGVEVKSHIIKAIGILKIENVQVQNPELHSAYLAYYAKLNAAKTNGEIIRFFFLLFVNNFLNHKLRFVNLFRIRATFFTDNSS